MIDLEYATSDGFDIIQIGKDCSAVNLSGIDIRSIDLTPLTDCSELHALNLSDNELRELDLGPLHSCRKLVEINLSRNNLKSIDLSALAFSTIRRAMIDQKHGRPILLFEPIFREVEFKGWKLGELVDLAQDSREAPHADWAKTVKALEERVRWTPDSSWFAVQRGLLRYLSMIEIGGVDGDPRLILEDVSAEHGEEILTRIYEKTVSLLSAQLRRGGPTVFLDVEVMKRTSAACLVPEILESREKEMEDLIVPIRKDRAYLDEVVITHYGFEVVMGLGLEMRVGKRGLKRLKKSFEEVGYIFNTEEVQTVPKPDLTRASFSLRNYIQRVIAAKKG
ncbi:MAG: leucine-rich repeat domain-containing protein [Candidatus Thorarchaeota archaeon]|nr:MAG: leucine-rich repeat domain-containing protein [Candidatus Thorarchaeota archaeon]